MSERPYEGKVTNSGIQIIKAPMKQPDGKKPTMLKGTDLRGSKGGK